MQFTDGTGGRLLYSPGRPPVPENLAVFQNDSFGPLKMTLHPDSYDFAWMSAEGQPAFSDAGVNVACG